MCHPHPVFNSGRSGFKEDSLRSGALVALTQETGTRRATAGGMLEMMRAREFTV